MNESTPYIEVALATGEKRSHTADSLRARLTAIGAHKDDTKALFLEGKAFCLPGAVFRPRDAKLDLEPNIQAALPSGAWGFDR